MSDKSANWFTIKNDLKALVGALDDLFDQTIKHDAPRLQAIREASARYELRTLGDLTSYGYQQVPVIIDGCRVRWPIGRMSVKAATAKIAGTQQPKVQFVTSDADWSIKRKAKHGDRFIEGLWSQRQEPYCDIWELGSIVFRDACVAGDGYGWVIGDEDACSVLHERVLPENVFHPHAESGNGAPLTRMVRCDVSREALKGLFTEPGHAEIIDSAPAVSTIDNSDLSMHVQDATHDRVELRLVWRRKVGKQLGRHVVWLKGASEPLENEPWERESFPVVRFSFERALRGMFNTSLMDESRGTEYALNELLGRVLDAVKRTPVNEVWAKTDSISDEELAKCEDASVHFYTGTKPDLQAESPFSPAIMELMNLLWERGFEVSSLNQMSVTAQKQPGITANSALLTMADIQTELFSGLWRAYQQWFVDMGRQDIYAVRDIVEVTGAFPVRWRGAGYLSQIDWHDLDLQDDQFQLAMQPAPSTKGTAAGRVQSAEDMYQAGALTLDALTAVRQYFDSPGELDRITRQRELIDRMMERWLDATDDQLKSGMYDADRQIPLIQTDGLKFMRLEDAIVQVADGYFEAVLDEAPDAIKILFLDWLAIADENLRDKQAAAALAQQQVQQGVPQEPTMTQAGPVQEGTIQPGMGPPPGAALPPIEVAA